MKIKYLKINNFGKLNNKEINLKNNINLISGENEAGKTTLLKFISGMFYGISKNKNGKEISDFDKYNPWNKEEFSGKIIYELDNKEQYEVFRDFSKKNPKIYNSNLEDISKEFTMDKNKQNQFFYDQTKIEENLFFNTAIVEQAETVLDINSQNNLTQKIANILSSGEDNISYKKIIEKLNKKTIEEIGTDRTQGRPINVINQEIKDLKNKINLLENNKSLKNNILAEKEEKSIQICLLENEVKILKEIKLKKENEKIELEKIKINENIKKEYEEKIKNIKNEKIKKSENKNNKISKKTNKLAIILILILFLLNILINIIKLDIKIRISAGIVSIVTFIVLEYIIRKNKKEKIKTEINLEKIKTENEINLLQENINKKNNEILNNKNIIEENKNAEIKYLIEKYNNILNSDEIIDLFNKSLEEIEREINLLENKLNKNKIEINTLYLEEKGINEKEEEYSETEERLEYLYSEKEDLEKLNNYFNLIKKCLENAYSKMKNNVTPKFTKDLSELMEKISQGKYRNVKFKTEEGLVVELENGEYINGNRLSIGTIDQLYLSLRLSSIEAISQEKMPIILDEAFAYYDNQRLENILKYLYENYKDNQIIIFTCNNREKEIFDKLGIEYNLICI